MRLGIVLHITGLLMIPFSSMYLPPLFLSLLHHDGMAKPFLISLLITMAWGLLLILGAPRRRAQPGIREGFLITALFWTTTSTFGSLPFLLAPQLQLDFASALFESTSGLTTTGATILQGLDTMAPSLLFYRHLLQWLGGIGIIVLAVGILPFLETASIQLYRTEASAQVRDHKLTPRMADTAKVLFFVYLLLTVCCTLAYYLAGMSFFDALCHSLSTVSIGGFSTHDASMGHFASGPIHLIAMFFMVVCGINFALHVYTWRKISLRPYQEDAELRLYLALLGLAALACCAGLFLLHTQTLEDALWHGAFQAVSLATTTGFTTANFSSWPGALPFFLLLCACAGACAGSTGGGIKIVRLLLILKQGMKSIVQLVHPAAISHVKVGYHTVPRSTLDAMWGFLALYIVIFLVITLLLLCTGLDFTSAFSATAATLNNLGPGLGDVSQNYQSINTLGKWLLCASMLLGRLELCTRLALFTPVFWRG